MVLMHVADKLDDLPEGLRAKARQVDNKFHVPAGTDGFELEQTAGFRNTVASERERADRLASKLKMYGWRVDGEGKLTEGEDVIHVDVARDAIAKVKSGSLGEPRDIKAAREEIAREYKEKYEREKAQFDLQRQQDLAVVYENIVMREADAAVRANGGNDLTMQALLPTIKERVRVERTTDGKLYPAVYSPQGKQLISRKNGSSDPMGLAEFVATLREDPVFKPNFPSTRAGGSGATHASGGGSASGGGTNSDSSQELTGERAFAAMLEGNVA